LTNFRIFPVDFSLFNCCHCGFLSGFLSDSFESGDGVKGDRPSSIPQRPASFGAMPSKCFLKLLTSPDFSTAASLFLSFSALGAVNPISLTPSFIYQPIPKGR
jgi:hypothetical protein